MASVYRVFWSLLFLCLAFRTEAQTAAPYGDEWISYGQTYLRIPVPQPGVYRVPKAALDAAGMPAGTTGAALRMHYLGTEVPLRVSTTGPLGAGDYAEFAGRPANGAADAELYGTARQTDPGRSLFSDTAAYFLTWGTAAGLRYTDATATIPGTPASIATWGWSTVRQAFSGYFAQGTTCDPGNLYRLPSADFAEGEGFIHASASPGAGFSTTLATPGYSAASGASAVLTTGVVGYSLALSNTSGYTPPNLHPIKVWAGGQLLVDTTYGAQECRHFTRALAPASLGSSTLVQYQSANIYGPNYDYWGVAFTQLRYPRTLDFTGATTAQLTLEPSAAAQALTLTGFAHGGIAPVLYDLTNNTSYTGDIAVSGQTRFYLQPSAQPRELMLWASSAVQPATGVRTVQFTDWSTAPGGDYVIITHRKLTGSGGADPVAAYRDYRASAAGGGHKVIVAYTDDLYDQFGWGICQNPLSFRRFLRRLQASAPVKPEQLLLLGHGLNYAYTRNAGSTPVVQQRGLVPTWGHPGFDGAFATLDAGGKAALAVGRIAAISASEVADYLTKVKAYEAALKPAPMPTAATELWKKEVLHIAGAREPDLQTTQLLPTLRAGEAIIDDTAFGALVTTVAKNTTNPVDPTTNGYVDSLINRGNGIITFHGHAYAGGFDYNINTPEQYTNTPRLPLFLGLGCDVAQMFDTTNARTISERYVLTPNGGAIAMVAADMIQFTSFHSLYLPVLYSGIGSVNYGKTMGRQLAAAYDSVRALSGDNLFRAHLESLVFHGDPATSVFAVPKPDYHIGADGLSTIPSVVSTVADSFRLNIVSYNLGRAVRDSAVVVRVTHIAPNGTEQELRRYGIATLLATDTTSVWIPVNKVRDLGLNRYRVDIDPDNRVAEMHEGNNGATLDLFIYGDNLIPVYPKEFAIVGTPNVTLKASTLNPFSGAARYRMELDTSAAFNSAAKVSYTTSGPGGVVRWSPMVPLKDSTVYYWRAAYDSMENGTYRWGTSSFLHLAGSTPGWNQSHVGQWLQDGYDALDYSADQRRFRFGRTDLRIYCRTKVMTTAPDAVENNKIQVNEVDFQRSGCAFVNTTTMQIMVIDSATGSLWKNSPAAAAANGSVTPCGANRGTWAFEFILNNTASRNRARRFLDSIPAGHFVLVKNCIYAPTYSAAPVSAWMSDTLANGSGVSLYHTLKTMGFADVDSFTRMQPFLFWCQKGIAGTPVYSAVGESDTTQLEGSFVVHPYGYRGTLHGTVVGPAKQWNELHWKTTTTDGLPQNDSAEVRVYGITGAGLDTLLMRTSDLDASLTGIPAATYPMLRLEWTTRDSMNRTPAQLAYWRVLHTPVPEIALNPAAHFAFDDSLQVGQGTAFSVAVENLSDDPMDSVLVRYRIATDGGTVKPLSDVRYRPLAAGDTLHAHLEFDPSAFPGQNYLFVEANPDGDHPEQYHPNNLGYVPFRVQSDVVNPLLEVTFDGIVIRNRDIVSARPLIKVRLTDGNQYRTLNDTSLIDMYVRYPNDPLSSRGRRVPFDGSVCRFIPATAGAARNEAVIEYRPYFKERSVTDDQSFYDLAVSARDRSGNPSGGQDYKVTFEIVWQPTVTNVVAFPNPFSTSTAFAFTLTGSAVPEEFSIEVADMTGRLVRRISRQELGGIHVGRNQTSYQWDGRDAGGTPLPSGLYLYRAVWGGANSVLGHRASDADGSFRGGWARLVIVR